MFFDGMGWDVCLWNVLERVLMECVEIFVDGMCWDVCL